MIRILNLLLNLFETSVKALTPDRTVKLGNLWPNFYSRLD